MAEQNTTGQNSKTKKKSAAAGCLGVLVKHIFVASCAFIASGLLFLVTMDRLIMPIYQQTGKEIKMPDLRGMTVDDADRLLHSLGLSATLEKEDYNLDYPEGTIYLQIPHPSTKIKPGRNIRIHLSKGQRPIRLPNVVGLSRREAREKIRDVGLRVNDDVAWIPSNESYNMVAAQVPSGDSDVPDTTMVTLFISNGVKVTNTVMPDLRNLSLSAARDTLLVRGFNLNLLKVEKEEDGNLLPDTVIDQVPSPGKAANRDDEVYLVITAPGKNER